MGNRTNCDRAFDAARAIELHSDLTAIHNEDALTQVSDLLCNLHHYCNKNGIDWGCAVERGKMHAEAEQQEELESSVETTR